ncbi:patatin family protein [Schnuerera sp. xch1]|uniref:patatin-like phospholipase family protein n=1 Tax=Schnuerera sp. xch1 TaxID=2874283 RepID=UPI001CBFF8A5|nr:patatin family protein [Schnuerera sp. xch1]MBZ2174557.1 patatin family protein [Schnuerera sp. xch1]
MKNKNIGLILEGGGMRGAYTAGVIAAFIDENIKFPYVIGVSAGANNGADYVSKQKERNKRVFVDYVSHKDYSGIKYLVKDKSFFNMNFLFETLPDKLDPFDYETFFNSETIFKVCATEVSTGKPVYFEKRQFKERGKKFMAKVLKASSSLPIISPPVEIDGRLYFDGGVSDSIPIDKSLEDGNAYNVLILTRNEGYVKEKQRLGAYSRHCLSKYPRIYDAIKDRHIRYNVTLEKIETFKKEGFAYIFRPIDKIKVNRIEKDTVKLNELYEQGYRETIEQMDDFKKWLDNIS